MTVYADKPPQRYGPGIRHWMLPANAILLV